MKRLLAAALLLAIVFSPSYADKRMFNTEKTIWVMYDGSIQKSDNTTKTRSFDAKGNYIYDSGIRVDGGQFGTDVPFKIYTTEHQSYTNDKLFGIVKNPFSSEKPETVVSAVTIHAGLSPLAETLVLGETFYILSRPLVSYNGFIIETGRIVK